MSKFGKLENLEMRKLENLEMRKLENEEESG